MCEIQTGLQQQSSYFLQKLEMKLWRNFTLYCWNKVVWPDGWTPLFPFEIVSLRALRKGVMRCCSQGPLADSCRNCGYRFTDHSMFCRKCGTKREVYGLPTPHQTLSRPGFQGRYHGTYGKIENKLSTSAARDWIDFLRCRFQFTRNARLSILSFA